MLNNDDLEAFDYYQHVPDYKSNVNFLWDYTDFVESMILTRDRDRLAENALGLVGEAGEVAEKIKKFFRDGTLDNEALSKELGDVMFYWIALHGAFDLDPYETIQNNINKLNSRKNNGTLRGSGDER